MSKYIKYKGTTYKCIDKVVIGASRELMKLAREVEYHIGSLPQAYDLEEMLGKDYEKYYSSGDIAKAKQALSKTYDAFKKIQNASAAIKEAAITYAKMEQVHSQLDRRIN